MSRPSPTMERYLTGNATPVTSEVTEFDLPVSGTLPAELDGRYLYIGSNPVAPPDPATYNVFTGDGMVYGLRLRGGRAEWYRNRWVRSSRVSRVLGEPEVSGPRHGLSDNANAGLVSCGGRTLALVDAGGLPVELTGELETIARTDLDGTLPNGFTSHPERDPDTGELYAVAYYHELSHVQYLVLDVNGRVRKAEAISVQDTPMMHELSLTEHHVVLYDLPVTYSDALRQAGSLLPYRWDEDHGARIGILPREGGDADVRWFDVDTCFVFHPLNAYEDGDRIIIDVVRYPQVFVRDAASVRDNGGRHTLWRWTVDLAGGTTRQEQLLDRLVEFPRIDERRNGRSHRYGYAVSYLEDRPTGLAGHGLVKHDLHTADTQVHHHGAGRCGGEGLFVPRSADAPEDGGWILCYVYDAGRDASDLVVIDAEDFTSPPVASVHLSSRVPPGFHGAWVPGGAGTP